MCLIFSVSNFNKFTLWIFQSQIQRGDICKTIQQLRFDNRVFVIICNINSSSSFFLLSIPTIFQIWGRAIGGVQLSSAEESNPQKDQTGQFAFREQVILSLLIFSFWSYHQKPKQKIFFYRAHGNENKNI